MTFSHLIKHSESVREILSNYAKIRNIIIYFWKMAFIPFSAVNLVECIYVIVTTDGGIILREKKLYILELVCQVNNQI